MDAPLAGYRSDFQNFKRRLPVGAECLPNGRGVHFRVWAPRRERVEVLIETPHGHTLHELEPQAGGYHAGVVEAAHAGTRYKLKLAGGEAYPDPASRYQPEGPHGPSEVVDPAAYNWSDEAWPGLPLHGQVIYELHVGSYTGPGTWAAARQQLATLAALGVTAIELMPVAEFAGSYGWGYDGVCWFAPTRLYGRPDDFRAFVDHAHAMGLGVLLDVVYNHYGPEGCYLREFSEDYFSKRHGSEWGETPNFDGPQADAVREMVLANAAHWVEEYHLDGLRLDATQGIHDDSETHLLQELGQRVRQAAGHRATLIVNENEPQQASLVRPVERGGIGLDMIWNDDWHHSAMVVATAQDEAYYTDYRGHAQEFVSAARHGFLYQGQWYRWQGRRRGSPALDIEPARFVHFLQNHDQVANSGCGERGHLQTSPALWRALTGLLLLGPQTPLLFQGQEFASSAPFVYFADHPATLAPQVAQGRRDFMAQFAHLAQPDMQARLSEPARRATFERCKLDHHQRESGPHRQAWEMHRDLLRLRREDATLRHAQRERHATDGAVLGDEAFVLRFFGEHGDGSDDRLLVVNLGRALHLDPAPEPLLAPPESCAWRVLWSSQDPRHGGIGSLLPDAAEQDRVIPGRELPRPFDNWRLQGETTLLLAPGRAA